MIILLPRNRESQFGFKERKPDPSGIPSPDSPAARIRRAYKLRQQLAETPGEWTARGLFLWRSIPQFHNSAMRFYLHSCIAVFAVFGTEPSPRRGLCPDVKLDQKKAGTKPRPHNK